MDIKEAIREYSGQPLTHQMLVSILHGYSRPNDKLHGLVKTGVLTPVKRGLYVQGNQSIGERPDPFLVANILMGPSYVSMESALSYYGLIPERVYEVTSMTTKPSREFDTEIGLYSYTKLPLPYYSFGIKQVSLAERGHAMVASPEKALCDKIISTGGVIFRGLNNVRSYLFEDLRIDEDSLRKLDTATMSTWLTKTPKKTSLEMLISFIQDL